MNMPQPILDDSFIVITGHHPKSGKRERISRVRAHITKRYFQELYKSKQGIRPYNHKVHNRDAQITDNRLLKQVDTAANLARNPLLDSKVFAEETTRRMHKFYNLHLRAYNNGHPFLKNLTQWANTCTHFTSAKLLNASGWDDILESGRLSQWTTRQRCITQRLLHDTLTHDPEEKKNPATFAALQSLLGFELFLGDNDSILQLKAFCQSLLAHVTNLEDDTRFFLLRGQFLLSAADRLRLASNGDSSLWHNIPSLTPPKRPLQDIFTAFEVSLFTLNGNVPASSYQDVCKLVHELHSLISIAAASGDAPPDSGFHNFLGSWHNEVSLQTKCSNHGDICTQRDDNDHFLVPLRFANLILTTCLISGHVRNLALLATQLRLHLQSSRDQLSWLPFPGALIWCHAIGLRFADPVQDRTWFLMHFLRTSHLNVLGAWEESSRSIELVVSGLERIDRI